MRLKKTFKWIVIFALVVPCIYYAAVVAIGLTAKPVESELAVVLGNEVLSNGQPSERLAERVKCALALYKQKKVKRIMVSGGRSVHGFDEATVMKEYLMNTGVPAAAIIVDSEGVNTMATAHNAAAYMKKENIQSAVIVTQYFHIPRTMLAFHMAGIENYTADYPNYFEMRDVFSTLREMVGIPVYWMTK